MSKKKLSAIIFVLCFLLCTLVGCGKGGTDKGETDKTEKTTKSELALEGKSLLVYCGAGMTKPFTDITNKFQEETGATVQVSYGNAAQIISQITTSQDGDLFIAGDSGELEPLEKANMVKETKPLVKHIPVLATQTGNPKEITQLSDLTNTDIRLLLGDNESTPIGKIGDKVLKDAGIFEKVNIIARTTTAPEMVNALSLGECDAAIVWKENANIDGVTILEIEKMKDYIKTIPAASLNCGKNEEVRKAFVKFLDSKEVLSIWKKYGYEQVDSVKK